MHLRGPMRARPEPCSGRGCWDKNLTVLFREVSGPAEGGGDQEVNRQRE